MSRSGLADEIKHTVAPALPLAEGFSQSANRSSTICKKIELVLLLDILVRAQQKPVIAERLARVSGKPGLYDGLNVAPPA